MNKEIILKQRELEIAKEFHRVCEKLHLKYILAFGSMIGCARHNGFIPWDDDIDIAMPYNDYIKFIKDGQKELKSEYFIQTNNTDPGYTYPFTKIRLRNSCVLNVIPDADTYKEHGIYIDIFPVLFVPKNRFKYQQIAISNFIWGQVLRFNNLKSISISNKNIIVKVFLLCLFFTNKIFSSDRVMKILFSKALSVKEYEAKALYIADFNSEFDAICRCTMPMDAFYNRILMPFENTYFYMPVEYDSILKNMYGNYMILPPENERRRHNFLYISDRKTYMDYLNEKE